MTRTAGQAAVHMGWEDLEGVCSCQQIDLGNHYSGDVQDRCLLVLAEELQSLWVLGNRVKETMARHHTWGCMQVDWEKEHFHRGLGNEVGRRHWYHSDCYWSENQSFLAT